MLEPSEGQLPSAVINPDVMAALLTFQFDCLSFPNVTQSGLIVSAMTKELTVGYYVLI